MDLPDDDELMLAALEAAEASLPAAPAVPAPAPPPFATPAPVPAPRATPPPALPAKRSAPSAPPPPPGALEATLAAHFGYGEFRPGQRAVIEAALTGRDAAVFWATGSGKSLCYQMPALHRRKTHMTVVCSPLISLMQDQVLKLNATAGEGVEELATFLGSGQMDSSAEARALSGEFALVYVSPEKLLGGGFLEALARMHKDDRADKKVGLFAVDEAHCVSEWGHDFRPEFRRLGEVRAALPDVPTMALTATAVPRVRADIREGLGLQADALVAVSSFDRPNLVFDVRTRADGRLNQGYVVEAVLRELAGKLAEESAKSAKAGGGGAPKSTIVYCSTRGEVDTVYDYLRLSCGESCTRWVEKYHAGLDSATRRRVHNGFVSNAGAAVIVATVAFGMGIDKPDIRRVVHYGPPKSVEEYYQQAGRAGRDGLQSECIMYAKDADFTKYLDRFYTDKLQGTGLKAYRDSLAALRQFAREAVCCRRKLLLEHLGEADAPFGQRCGTCDTCSRHAGSEPLTHDYGPEARVVLQAMQVMRGAARTKLTKLVMGIDKQAASQAGAGEVARRRARMKAIRASQTGGASAGAPTGKIYETILTQLVQMDYASQATIAGQHGSWDVYNIKQKGVKALRDAPLNAPITRKEPVIELPLSSAMLEARAAFEAKKAALLSLLAELGIDRTTLPTVALASGEMMHPAIMSIVRLAKKLRHWRDSGRGAEADAVDELCNTVRAWRAKSAAKLGCAPSSVLTDAVVANIAYSEVDDVEALRASGARVAGVEELATAISEWKRKHRAPKENANPDPENTDAAPMQLPAAPWRCAKPFQPLHAYKRRKPTAKLPDPRPNWEVSADAVLGGASLQAVALNQANGKSIQVRSVLKHCLKAMEFCLPQGGLPLRALAAASPPPNASEWVRMEEAVAEAGADLFQWNSYPHIKDLLAIILGDAVLGDWESKSTAQRDAEAVWFSKFDWFITLKRVGFEASFGSDGQVPTKRQKVA